MTIKLLSTPRSGAEGLEFNREMKIMSQLRGQCFPQFFGACLEEGHESLVMEYMPNGSLRDYLGKNKLTPAQQKKIAIETIYGLRFLHKRNMIHQDLSSKNILLDRELNAKISNFGLTKTLHLPLTGKRSQAAAYCAPEILSGKEFTDKADIYSFGTILWEIFTGKKPFASLSAEAMSNKVQQGQREILTEDIPVELQKIIQACWSADPEKRPQASSLIQQFEAYKPLESLYRKAKSLEEKKDYPAAMKHYQIAADGGLANALTSLGMFSLMGLSGEKPDKIKAYQLFLAAAVKGHQRGMKNLAIMLDKGDGIQQDQAKAMFWYQQVGDPASLKRVERLKEKLSIHPWSIWDDKECAKKSKGIFNFRDF